MSAPLDGVSTTLSLPAWVLIGVGCYIAVGMVCLAVAGVARAVWRRVR